MMACTCVLIIAMTLAALFPATALAAPDSLASRTKGSILIRYSKDYASYDVYRLFDLAVTTNGTSVQDDDTYEYVISETIVGSSATEDTGSRANPWWTFLITYGPDGQDSATPYAVLSSETNSSKKASALFIIDVESLTLGGKTDFHVVHVADRYAGMSDIVRQSTTIAGETAGTEAATFIQDFAQAALAFAGDQSFNSKSGRYLAKGREAYGTAVDQTNTDSVYQYSGDTAYVTNIPLGVYLLEVDEGMFCSMDVANSSALVYDRKEYPELFVQVRAKDAPAIQAAFDQLTSDEQHDLVWSEDNLMRWAYRTDVNLGELVQFKTVIIAQQGITDYRLHDVMERGLTFLSGTDNPSYSPQVYIYCQATDTTYEVPSKVGKKTNWVLHTRDDTDGAPSDLCDFEIEFKDVVQAAAKEGEEKLTFACEEMAADGSTAVATQDVADWDRIVVTYWAQVNEDAVVFGSDRTARRVRRAKDLTRVKSGAEGTGDKLPVQTHAKTDGNSCNTNSAVLTYGDASHTTWARAEVASYQFDIVRTGATSAGAYPLVAGAQFALYKTVSSDVTGAVAYTAEVNHEQKTYYYLPDEPLQFVTASEVYTYASDENAQVSEGTLTAALTSSNESVLRVRGIEAGIYLLVENEAPAGLTTTGQPIVVTVHNRAYSNNDPVEDSTPGLKHSNAEGDITVTSYADSGKSETEVYRWRAKVSGNPVVYKRETVARASSGSTTLTTPTSRTKSTATNGGVLVCERSISSGGTTNATKTSNHTSILEICMAVIAILGCVGAAIGIRALRQRWQREKSPH